MSWQNILKTPIYPIGHTKEGQQLQFTETQIKRYWERRLPELRDLINGIDRDHTKYRSILLVEPEIKETEEQFIEMDAPRGATKHRGTWVRFVTSKKLGDLGEKQLQKIFNKYGYTISTKRGGRKVENPQYPESQEYYIGVTPEKVEEIHAEEKDEMEAQGIPALNPHKKTSEQKIRNWKDKAEKLDLLNETGFADKNKFKQKAIEYASKWHMITQGKWLSKIIKDFVREEKRLKLKFKTDVDVTIGNFMKSAILEIINDDRHFNMAFEAFRSNFNSFDSVFENQFIRVAWRDGYREWKSAFISTGRQQDMQVGSKKTKEELRALAGKKRIGRKEKRKNPNVPSEETITNLRERANNLRSRNPDKAAQLDREIARLEGTEKKSWWNTIKRWF